MPTLRFRLLPTPRAHRLVLAAAVVAIVALSTGCGGDGAGSTLAVSPTTPTNDDGVQHIHGLGVDPADDALIVATHTGLFRSAPGETSAERIADRYQDTMGFTVVGPRRYLGSGHPDISEGLPPLLGLIRSDDAGQSWKPISLLGEADFHILETSGSTIYGFEATGGRLLASADGGESWQRRVVPDALVDLAIDPRDDRHLIASSPQRLFESEDGGRSWRPLGDGQPGMLAWTPEALTVVDPLGNVWRANSDHATFRHLPSVGGQPAALVADGEDLYVALHTNEVKVSQDGGKSWRTRLAP